MKCFLFFQFWFFQEACYFSVYYDIGDHSFLNTCFILKRRKYFQIRYKIFFRKKNFCLKKWKTFLQKKSYLIILMVFSLFFLQKNFFVQKSSTFALDVFFFHHVIFKQKLNCPFMKIENFVLALQINLPVFKDSLIESIWKYSKFDLQ